MTVRTSAGTKLYIGTTTAAETETEFLADTYVEIGEIESMGDFGDESNPVNFASLNDERMRKLKGTRDAGTLALVCGRDPLDTGQLALDAAEETDYEYNFKVEYDDAPSALYTPSLEFFRGLVMGRRTNVGNNDNVTRKNYNIAINSEIVDIPAHL